MEKESIISAECIEESFAVVLFYETCGNKKFSELLTRLLEANMGKRLFNLIGSPLVEGGKEIKTIISKLGKLGLLTREMSYELKRERDVFMEMKKELLGNDEYKGKWVAIVKGKLLGPSDDDSELSRMVDEKYGNVPAYIGKIIEKKEILELPPRELE